MTDVAELAITGRVATAADADWDDARQAWNLAAEQQPAAVAFAESADDASAVLRFAAERGMKVNAQGTGHGAAPLESLEETILIRTTEMKGIEVDGAAGTARVEAGVVGEELGAAAQAHGRCSQPGSSPNVGTIGYTLGGGLGWLGRRHGFACNLVRAIELVTADGEQRRVDADHEPDLFWALRGGGGDYAIVTALDVDLLPISEAYAGALIFPAELGAEAVRAYRDWAAALPDEVTSRGRFLRPPPMPDVPEPLRDRPLWTVTAACLGSREEGERRVARYATSASRSWTPSTRFPPPGSAGSTWTRSRRPRPSVTICCCAR
jgi:FAD/FMN-containing dehydrogenase